MNTNKLEVSIVGLACLFTNFLYLQIYQSSSVKFYEAPLDVKVLYFALIIVTNILFFLFVKYLKQVSEPVF
jgi:hypothetical protein